MGQRKQSRKRSNKWRRRSPTGDPLLLSGALAASPARPWWARLWWAIAYALGLTDGGALSLAEPYCGWVRQGSAIGAAIEDVIVRLPRRLRHPFQPLAQQARGLVADLEHLARAAAQMDEYLTGPYGRTAALEVEQLRAELAAEEDPLVRERLEQALRAVEDALADQQEIRRLREQVEAEAAQISACLQSVLSEVVKQRSCQWQTAYQELGSVTERIQYVKSQVDAIQQVIGSRSSPERGPN